MFHYLVICLAFSLPAYAKEEPKEQKQPVTVIKEAEQSNSNDDTDTPVQTPVKQSVSSDEQRLILAPTEPSDYVKQKQELSQQFRRDLPSKDEAKKRRKEHKPKASRAQWLAKRREPKEKLTMSQMNFKQLLQRKNELLLEGEYEVAVKYLEKMFSLAENADQMVFIMLEWAEALMKIEKFTKAEKLFDDFIKLYPGNEYAEQAFVKAIECSWQQTARHDRDQTKTESTLNLIEQFESRNAAYAQESIERVQQVKSLCHQKLADNNLYIAQHYIGRGVFLSAHKRLEQAREQDLKMRPNIEPEVLRLEIELAQAEHNQDMHQQKVNELTQKFPQHEITLALKPEPAGQKQTT